MVKGETREVKLLFKAQGTFQGSKPTPNSPYPLAGPFFSNSILGQQVWPGDTSIEGLHHRLSMALNDRHRLTGIVGDWRETHDRAYGGYWSFRVEKFEEIKISGQKTRYRILYQDYQEI